MEVHLRMPTKPSLSADGSSTFGELADFISVLTESNCDKNGDAIVVNAAECDCDGATKPPATCNLNKIGDQTQCESLLASTTEECEKGECYNFCDIVNSSLAATHWNASVLLSSSPDARRKQAMVLLRQPVSLLLLRRSLWQPLP
jgi:hypothetical protein